MLQKDTREKTNFIPLEITEIILSKLPLRDVLRFKAVSKSWRAIILNPRFARVHLNNARYNSDDQLLMRASHHDTGLYNLGRFDGFAFQPISHLQCPLGERHRCLCSCDGFFLIHEDTSNMCVLWNPITQSKMSFAYPETMTSSPYDTTHGICYDPLEDDYKVIFVDVKSLLYTVFSCRNSSWTEPKQFPYKDIETYPGVSVGGVPYWNSYLHRSWIVYLDAKECEFKKLHKPDEVIGSGSRTDSTCFLTNLNGRLCLCRYNYYGNYCYAYMDIWVLVEEEDNNNNKSWQRVPAWPPLPCAIKASESGSIYSLFVDGPKQPYILFFAEKKLDAPSIRCHGTSPILVALRASLAVLPPPQTAAT